MNDAVTEAFHHVSHRCLGRRLKPLTLRHAFSLSIAGSPFFSGGDITTDDLRQAVEICSRPSVFFTEGNRPGFLRRLWWEIRTRRMDIEQEKLRLHVYLGDHCTKAEVWHGEGAKPIAMDWVVAVVSALMGHFGMTSEAAWEMSPGEAITLLAAWDEQNGRADVVDTDAVDAVHGTSEEELIAIIEAQNNG